MAVDLKTFRSILRQFKWICDSSRIPGEFQVIGIYAYVADSTFLSSLTPPVIIHSKTAILLHDIVITDGTDKLKCFLALPLSDFVQKRILKVGDYIQLNSVKLCYLEGEYGDQHIVTYVLLEDIEISERAVVTFPNLGESGPQLSTGCFRVKYYQPSFAQGTVMHKLLFEQDQQFEVVSSVSFCKASLRFLESNNAREQELKPLVTSRKCYLDVWITCYPLAAPMWFDAASIIFVNGDSRPNVLQKLEDLSSWRQLPKPYPALLLRVLYRGLLQPYGHNLHDKAFPFVGYLYVADETRFVNMVIFDKQNLGLFYNAVPGTILLVENYSITEPFLQRQLPSRAASLANVAYMLDEIIVGHSTTVKIIPSDCSIFSQEIALLPPVKYSFVQRASLRYVADGAKVDFVGLIVHISRFERFRYKYKGLRLRYWVEIIDGTNHLPVKILMYVDPHRFDLKGIHPGQLLVGTQFKVHHVPLSLVADDGIYLELSTYSELYVEHHQDRPYQRQGALLDLCSWIRDHGEEISYIKDNVLRVGGFIHYPPPATDLETYKADVKFSSFHKMVPGAIWMDTLKKLNYRERLRFSLGGFIVKVEYVNVQTVPDGPAYGWFYSHTARSRNILFINIRLASKLKNLPRTNWAYNDHLCFPKKYTNEQKEDLQRFRNFPPTTAEEWEPSADNAIRSIPFHTDGYYIVTVVSLHYQNTFQCMLVPEPSIAPHPSFMELLSGEYQLLPMHRVTNFTSEPPRYTLKEVQNVHKTAQEVTDRTFVFALEAFCPGVDKYEVFLKRAYICPPDQIQRIMEDDNLVR